LAAAYRYRKDPAYLAGSRKAMDWLLQFQVKDTDAPDPSLPSPPTGGLLFRYPRAGKGKVPNQKLGTAAVAILGFVEWARATGSHDEDGRILAMAKFVRSMRDSSGRFEPYDVPSGHPSYGQVNDIVPGEAALALGIVAEYTGDASWLDFFPDFLK